MFYCFVPPDQVSPETIRITGPNARHLRLVLRTRPGEAVRVRSDRYLYETVVERVEPDDVLVRILSRSETTSPGTNRPRIILAPAVIQEKKFDLVLQSACQLGVSEIRPLLTEHTADHRVKPGRLPRWERILEESCMQSQNPDIPRLHEPLPFCDAVRAEKETDPEALLLMPWELESSRRMDDALFRERERVALFIGPEGGWSPDEAEFARTSGMNLVTLGPRILRAETAVTAGLTLILERTGQL